MAIAVDLALQYFHIYMWLGPFLEILRWFQKNGYIWGCEDIVNLFWSLHYWIDLGGGGGVISKHFMAFSEGKLQNGNLFWGHKISNIYLGMLDIPEFLLGKHKMLGTSLHMHIKLREHPQAETARQK